MSEGAAQVKAIGKPGWLGPVFFWELIRQTRKGRGYFARIVYASLLLLMLFSFFGRQQDVTQKEIGYLSVWAAEFYLLMQFLAVIFLTPIFVAGAFIEERQQRTLELLLTTHITARQLVLGKLFSRLIHVAAVLLVGLPVLAFLQLLGGVNITTVLWATFLTFITMLICGMYAIRASTSAKTFGGAIFTSYMMMVGGAFACIPLLVIQGPLINALLHSSTLEQWVLVFSCTGLSLNLVFGIASLRGAVHAVNKEPGFGTNLTFFDPHHVALPSEMVLRTKKQASGIEPGAPSELVREHRTERIVNIPPVTNYPILWKEMHFPYSDNRTILAVMGCILPLFIIFTVGIAANSQNLSTPGQFLEMRTHRVFLFGAIKGFMILFLAMATFRAAGTFSRERLQKTMAVLFTLPISHNEILVQTGLGNILRFWPFLISAYLLLFAYAVFVPVFYFPVLILYTAQISFYVAVGLFLSLSTSSPLTAKLIVGASFFFAYFVLPGVFDPLMFYSSPFLDRAMLGVMSPYSLWSLGTYRWSIEPLPNDLTTGLTPPGNNSDAFILLGTALVLFLLTLLLLLLCRWKLQRWKQRLA